MRQHQPHVILQFLLLGEPSIFFWQDILQLVPIQIFCCNWRHHQVHRYLFMPWQIFVRFGLILIVCMYGPQPSVLALGKWEVGSCEVWFEYLLTFFSFWSCLFFGKKKLIKANYIYHWNPDNVVNWSTRSSQFR